MIELPLPLAGLGAAGFAGLTVLQHRLLQTARQDPMTGLPTRQSWTSRAGRAVKRRRHLLLVVIDGDGFKQINDNHGHDAGDRLLAAFAQRLRDWTGADGLAARLGGDEFAAYTRLTPLDHVVGRLDTLCTDLSAPVAYGDTVLSAGASIGAVLTTELPAPSLYQAMRAADEALYRAKHAGGSRWRLAEQRTTPYPVTSTPIPRTRSFEIT